MHLTLTRLFSLAFYSALAAMFSAGASMAASPPKQERILGWLEHVRVEPVGLVMDAKLDTGAKTSLDPRRYHQETEKGR